MQPIQNLPGAKESGVGYYYDNKKKEMKRILFYSLSQGYPRETRKALDFYIEGKGFFVVELPGGWPAYTQDGRFELMTMGDWLHLMIISQYLEKMAIYICKMVALM